MCVLVCFLQHVWFDFHSECRGEGGWANLDKLLHELDPTLTQQGVLHVAADGAIRSLQHGVIRTNCIDCLDRTNVVSDSARC